MKLAVLSDIHANLEAFTRCMQFLDEEAKVDFTAVLGDITGYGADPVTCIRKVKEIADVSLIGNHDSAVIGTTKITYFNMVAREAITWTRTQISEEDHAYLASLPYTVVHDTVRFTHSSPNNPEQWKYIFNWFDTEGEFDHFTEPVCFVGHSHVPGIYERTEVIPHGEGPVQLNPDKKYIINIGSVGQPRDGDPRASFAVFDTETRTVEIIRLEYDIETARQKILDSGLPPVLGDRLLQGR